MSASLLNVTPGNWQRQLSAIVEIVRGMSLGTDPQEMVREYGARIRPFIGADRTISLSRRGLNSPAFRITRSDLWTEEINPWTQKNRLPLLEGGLLARLIYGDQPALIPDFQADPADPAYEHLAGHRCLIAIPHYDGGLALNMVVHLHREPAGFLPEHLPELVLLGNLFGRATRGLVLAADLQRANGRLHDQYRIITELNDAVLEQAIELKHNNRTLENRVKQRTADLEEANLDAVYMLAVASEAKDEDTGQHVRRIQRYSHLLATELGMAAEEAETLGHAALLHDVGKMHIPDEILKKPAPLTPSERRLMEAHTVRGEQMLSSRAFFTPARRIARSHHENWDGSGYPDGLAGESIPLDARIVRLVDVYDALTSRRPYKPAWPVAKAVAEIRGARGRLFDPVCVDAFERLLNAHGTPFSAAASGSPEASLPAPPVTAESRPPHEESPV